jgi:hypothetical protein
MRVGYTPVTASPLHACPMQFTPVYVGSRTAPCPVSCTLANPSEFAWTAANCANTLKSRFLNLGSKGSTPFRDAKFSLGKQCVSASPAEASLRWNGNDRIPKSHENHAQRRAARADR